MLEASGPCKVLLQTVHLWISPYVPYDTVLASIDLFADLELVEACPLGLCAACFYCI